MKPYISHDELRPVGSYQKFTVDNATARTIYQLYEDAGEELPERFTFIKLKIEGVDIRMREDGEEPTASDGTPIEVSYWLELSKTNVDTWSMIAQSGTATLHVQPCINDRKEDRI